MAAFAFAACQTGGGGPGAVTPAPTDLGAVGDRGEPDVSVSPPDVHVSDAEPARDAEPVDLGPPPPPDAYVRPDSARPPGEAECDGLDNDRDDLADDGYECVLGAWERCDTPCGSRGYRTCVGGCRFTPCIVPRELCNGVDDNCDGHVDENMPCQIGETRPCRQGCGPEGIQRCTAACAWQECSTPFVSCAPDCVADPASCRPPVTDCLLDANLDGNIDPGAAEISQQEWISYTDEYHYSPFVYAVADGGERVYGAWLGENPAQWADGTHVLQEYDGRGRPQRRTELRYPESGNANDLRLDLVDSWLILTIRAHDGDVPFDTWFVYDLDLNRLSGPNPGPGASEYLGQVRRCGPTAVCQWQVFSDGAPTFTRHATLWTADVMSGESSQTEVVPEDDTGCFGHELPLPGDSGYLIVSEVERAGGFWRRLSRWWVDGCESWRTTTTDRVDPHLEVEPPPLEWVVRRRGDPFDIDGLLDAINPAESAIARLTIGNLNRYMPKLNRRPIGVFEGTSGGGFGIAWVDLATGGWSGTWTVNSEQMGDHHGFAVRGRATFPNFSDITTTLELTSLAPPAPASVWTKPDNIQQMLGRWSRDGAGRIAWAKSASGQVLMNRIQCSRERTRADAP